MPDQLHSLYLVKKKQSCHCLESKQKLVSVTEAKLYFLQTICFIGTIEGFSSARKRIKCFERAEVLLGFLKVMRCLNTTAPGGAKTTDANLTVVLFGNNWNNNMLITYGSVIGVLIDFNTCLS